MSVEEKKLPLIVDNIVYSVTPTGNISYSRSVAKNVWALSQYLRLKIIFEFIVSNIFRTNFWLPYVFQ